MRSWSSLVSSRFPSRPGSQLALDWREPTRRMALATAQHVVGGRAGTQPVNFADKVSFFCNSLLLSLCLTFPVPVPHFSCPFASLRLALARSPPCPLVRSAGRRALRLHFTLFLHSTLSKTPALLAQHVSQKSVDTFLATHALGAGPGRALQLEKAMRWREVVSPPPPLPPPLTQAVPLASPSGVC